jgi:hypothetical protein
MSRVRLSDRQQFALLALDALGTPSGGAALAARMTADGRETSAAGAHQAASALAVKKLAIKGHPAGATHIRYEITNAGRELAATIRAAQAGRG